MTAWPVAGETGLGASYVLALSRRRGPGRGGRRPGIALALLGVAALWAAAAAHARRLAAGTDGRATRIGGVWRDVLGAVGRRRVLALLAAAAAVTAGARWRSPVSFLLALVSGSA